MLYYISILYFIVLCDAFDHFEDFLDGSEDDDFFKPNRDSRTEVPIVRYEWSYINFTWPSDEFYKTAVASRKYVPENALIGGIRFHRNRMFVSLPKYRSGVPATLTYMSTNTRKSRNNLLTPFPSWGSNDESFCENLQNVLGMEIDTKGIMWVVDGVRINNMNVDCPPKLLLLDLDNGKIIHSYTFPAEIALQNGGFLNDLVVDETDDGAYAYITDNSNLDPGLVVYSRRQNRSWKLRDSTMFAEIDVAGFFVDDSFIRTPLPVDGIALSPKSCYGGKRKIYFTTVSGLNLYSIETGVVKNEGLVNNGTWRYDVELIGKKQGHADGMMMDDQCSLYYTLIDLYGMGKWDSNEDFKYSDVFYRNRSTMIWTDTVAMDQAGYLYFTASTAHRYIFTSFRLKFTSDIKFRIFQMYTGTKNYLY